MPLAIARAYRKPYLNRAIRVYTYFFCGTPLLVQVYLFYFGLGQFEAVRESFIWEPILSSPWWCVMIAFTLNTAAYTTEFLRGAIETTPHGEIEAAKACGMSPFTRMRLVVLPNAFRRALPAYSNEVIFTLHGSVIASTVTLQDLLGVGRWLNGRYYLAYEGFLTAMVFYMAIVLLISISFKLAEKRFLGHLRPRVEPQGAKSPGRDLTARPSHIHLQPDTPKGTPMATSKKRELIEGRAALIVIDIQKSTFAPIPDDKRAIAHMPDYAERMARSKVVVDKAREVGIPVIFIQEIHRANLIDMGRETDGDEDVHCLDSNPLTAFAEEELGMRPDDYRISKRRYSAFYGTDLEILLKGLKAETLILVGGLTDVCVHYTFVDGHQGDYFCRVIEDCVAGSSLAAHQASLNAVEYLQHGAVRSLDEVLSAMQSQAEIHAA